jgi:CrcB protein
LPFFRFPEYAVPESNEKRRGFSVIGEGMKYVYVLTGSAAGGLARYLLSRWISCLSSGSFPIGTLAVNLGGCFIIGLLTGLFEYKIVSPHMRLLIFTGFLGGFTTFSTFGLETFTLLKDTEIRIAVTNVLLSNMLGIGLVIIGYISSQLLIKSFR